MRFLTYMVCFYCTSVARLHATTPKTQQLYRPCIAPTCPPLTAVWASAAATPAPPEGGRADGWGSACPRREGGRQQREEKKNAVPVWGAGFVNNAATHSA